MEEFPRNYQNTRASSLTHKQLQTHEDHFQSSVTEVRYRRLLGESNIFGFVGFVEKKKKMKRKEYALTAQGFRQCWLSCRHQASLYQL